MMTLKLVVGLIIPLAIGALRADKRTKKPEETDFTPGFISLELLEFIITQQESSPKTPAAPPTQIILLHEAQATHIWNRMIQLFSESSEEVSTPPPTQTESNEATQEDTEKDYPPTIPTSQRGLYEYAKARATIFNFRDPETVSQHSPTTNQHGPYP
jgi:hypothetical protein